MPKPHIPMKGIRLLSPSRQGKLRRHLIMAITSFHTLKYQQQKLAIETSRPHQIFVNIFECDQPNLPTNINAWIYVDHLASQFRKKIPADIQLYKHPSRLPLLRTVDERETNRVCPIWFIPLKYKWLNTILGENYVDMTLQTSLSKIINSRFYCALRDSLCIIRPPWPPCFLFKGNTRTLVDI